MTNADRIRSMTDEELAEFIRKVDILADVLFECEYPCKRDVVDCNSCSKYLEWLQQESEVYIK